MSRAGLNRKTALATLTMTLAAEAPDIDVVAGFKGPVFAFAHHRGITHTLIGGPFIAAIVVGLVWLIHKFLQTRQRKPKPGYPAEPKWVLLFLFAWLATLSHIFLDFTNNYGVRPFEPLSYKWYSGDFVFIVEPFLWAFLIGGLALPSLFRLVNEEIGSRSQGPRGRTGAIIAIVCVLLFWVFRAYQHSEAVAALKSRTYHGAEPIRVSAFPRLLNPFDWYGVVETEGWFEQLPVNSRNSVVDPNQEGRVRYRPQETELTLSAKRSYLGRVYLDWAQYPIAESEKRETPRTLYVVRFMDLRFDDPDRGARGLRSFVILDGQFRVVHEGWGGAEEENEALESAQDRISREPSSIYSRIQPLFVPLTRVRPANDNRSSR